MDEPVQKRIGLAARRVLFQLAPTPPLGAATIVLPRHLLTASAAAVLALAVPLHSQQPVAPSQPCVLTGTVTSAGQPLPGVAVTAMADDRLVAASSTAPGGAYQLRLAAAGTYRVRVELAAFAPVDQTVTLEPSTCHGVVNFTMTLASRVPHPPPASPSAQTSSAAPSSPNPSAAPAAASGPARNRRGGQAPGQSFQTLSLVADETLARQADAAPESEAGASLLLPPGFSPDLATESVTSIGGAGQLNDALLGDRFAGRGEMFGAPGEG